MDIPRHIKYLSIIYYLNAAIAALIGSLSLFSWLFPTLTGRDTVNDIPEEISNIGLQYGLNILITILTIFLLIFLGISLRKLKPWARIVTLAYSILTIFFGLLSLITGDLNISFGFFLQFYAVWVLFRPDVKEAFGVKIKNTNQ